jgi:chemotaxis protein histidine kinase CheA
MNSQMGLTEFFAMEAGEYLEQLDTLVSAVAGPDRDEFLRVSRALRGSALMANQAAIGDTAAALENLARALREDRVSWDPGTKQIATRSIDDLKILVRRATDWTEAESSKASSVAAELNQAAGHVTAPRRSIADQTGIDAGTRAFIAREGASVASALAQVAHALQRGTASKEQFDNVIRAMQPLRGLAVVPQITPLPELMDGVERAITAAVGGPESPNEFALLFDSAARGVSNASKEITVSGAAQADSPEAREFARRLGTVLDLGDDVIPIQELYFEDTGPHVLVEGTQASAPGRMVQLESVAHGEHLVQAADQLERAEWNTQRELRALALTATFRSLMTVTGGPMEQTVREFSEAAARAVSRGAPVHNTGAFAAQLRAAGEILIASPGGDAAALASRMHEVAATIEAIPAAQVAQQLEDSDGPLTRPPAPSAAILVKPDEPDPITAAEPATEPASPRSVAVPTGVADDVEDLTTSWLLYDRLREDLGDAEAPIELLVGDAPSLDEELVASVPTEVSAAVLQEEPVAPVPTEVSAAVPQPDAVVPMEQLIADAPSEIGAVQTASPAPPAPATDDEDLVSIADLCYSGSAALERALSVRNQIHGVLTEQELDRPLLVDLVEELLNLVDLSFRQD